MLEDAFWCSPIMIALWNLIVQLRGHMNPRGSYIAARRLLYEVGERYRDPGDGYRRALYHAGRNPPDTLGKRREGLGIRQIDQQEFADCLWRLLEHDLQIWTAARKCLARGEQPVLADLLPDPRKSNADREWISLVGFPWLAPPTKREGATEPEDPRVDAIEISLRESLAKRAKYSEENPMFPIFNVRALLTLLNPF